MENMEARTFIHQTFQGYQRRKEENNLYDVEGNIPKNIIRTYYHFVKKPEFHLLIDQYKRNYIYNEARVERNVTMEEQLGLGEIYDYICTFDFSKDYFNLFVTSLLLHQKLYSKCAYPEFGGKLRDDTAYLLNTSIEVMDANEAKKYFNSLIPVSDQIFLPLNQGDIFG